MLHFPAGAREEDRDQACEAEGAVRPRPHGAPAGTEGRRERLLPGLAPSLSSRRGFHITRNLSSHDLNSGPGALRPAVLRRNCDFRPHLRAFWTFRYRPLSQGWSARFLFPRAKRGKGLTVVTRWPESTLRPLQCVRAEGVGSHARHFPEDSSGSSAPPSADPSKKDHE